MTELDQRIASILVRLATTPRHASQIIHQLETNTDPSNEIALILYDSRKHLCPAMMPGYRRSGHNRRRLRAPR
jgi:hypothetical protein